MMFSELLQLQQTSPVVANDAPLEVYLGVARAAMHALVKRDGGQEGLENPRARSLLRELGFVEESLVQDGPQAILERRSGHFPRIEQPPRAPGSSQCAPVRFQGEVRLA